MPLFSRYTPWWCNPVQHEALSNAGRMSCSRAVRLRFGFKTTFCQKQSNVSEFATSSLASHGKSMQCGISHCSIPRNDGKVYESPDQGAFTIERENAQKHFRIHANGPVAQPGRAPGIGSHKYDVG